jgi:hypothetical protein
MPIEPPNDEGLFHHRPSLLTPQQWTFLRALSNDQIVADVIHAGQIIGDLDADALQVLRFLNSEDGKALRRFLVDARPELLSFLTELRKREIDDIGSAIETAMALKRAWSLFKTGLLFAIGALVGMVTIWDKIAAVFRSGPK